MSLMLAHSAIVSWNGTAFVTSLVTKPGATILKSKITGARAKLPAFRLMPRPARLRLDMKVSKKSSGEEAIRKPSSLEPEVTLYEGPPSWTELLLPGLSILTVIGVIPFSAALARQFWVRYRISNRSIYVRSGFMGREETEIVYRDIEEVRYVRRLGGVSADYVIMLKGGAKLELRAVPDFEKTYDFMMQRVSEEARERSNYKKDKTAN